MFGGRNTKTRNAIIIIIFDDFISFVGITEIDFIEDNDLFFLRLFDDEIKL